MHVMIAAQALRRIQRGVKQVWEYSRIFPISALPHSVTGPDKSIYFEPFDLPDPDRRHKMNAEAPA
jgi:hypothetical protein